MGKEQRTARRGMAFATGEHGGQTMVVFERSSGVLRVKGFFRPGWCGNLASGLSRRGIGIRRGRGVKGEGGDWQAELELDCAPCTDLPACEVRGWLVGEVRPGFMVPLVLRNYELHRSTRFRGCTSLYVGADDRVGFLAALLRRLAYFSLFPLALELETRDDRAHDRFFLHGAGGREPSDRTLLSLAAMLEANGAQPCSFARAAVPGGS